MRTPTGPAFAALAGTISTRLSAKAAADAIYAYRAEVLREAAQKIRNVNPDLMVGRRDAAVLADLIDPDGSGS